MNGMRSVMIKIIIVFKICIVMIVMYSSANN